MHHHAIDYNYLGEKIGEAPPSYRNRHNDCHDFERGTPTREQDVNVGRVRHLSDYY